MVSVDGNSKPYNLAATASETYYAGNVVKADTNAVTIIDAKGDTALGVVDQSTINSEQTARAARSGESIGVFLLGSGAIVKVSSVASQTWALGAEVYLDDTVDGSVTTSAATSTPIGHYVGAGETTSASDGDLIDVLLDVQVGAAAV